MERPYTIKDLKTDSTLGLLNGVFFTSIYSLYNIALNKPYVPSSTWGAKAKTISRILLTNTCKLSVVFLGANIVYGYTKRKEF